MIRPSVRRGLGALTAIPSEKVRYLLIGGYNTAVGCVSFALFYWLFADNAHYMVILVLTHVLCALNAFVGYRMVAFRSTRPVVSSGLRFALVYGAGFVANAVLLPPAVLALGGRVLPAQGLVIALIVVATYLAHRHFSFRPPGAPLPLPPTTTQEARIR